MRMGFWADRKTKRAFKSAHYHFRIEHSQWQQDVEIFKKIKRAFELAEKGEDAVSNLTVQKSGEVVLWIGQGQFHEAGKTAGRYEGTSQGISMPLFGGLRYRVGAMRGTFVPGDVIKFMQKLVKWYLQLLGYCSMDLLILKSGRLLNGLALQLPIMNPIMFFTSVTARKLPEFYFQLRWGENSIAFLRKQLMAQRMELNLFFQA